MFRLPVTIRHPLGVAVSPVSQTDSGSGFLSNKSKMVRKVIKRTKATEVECRFGLDLDGSGLSHPAWNPASCPVGSEAFLKGERTIATHGR